MAARPRAIVAGFSDKIFTAKGRGGVRISARALSSVGKCAWERHSSRKRPLKLSACPFDAYPFYEAALAELELRCGRNDIARGHFRVALGLTRNTAERRFITRLSPPVPGGTKIAEITGNQVACSGTGAARWDRTKVSGGLASVHSRRRCRSWRALGGMRG